MSVYTHDAATLTRARDLAAKYGVPHGHSPRRDGGREPDVARAPQSAAGRRTRGTRLLQAARDRRARCVDSAATRSPCCRSAAVGVSHNPESNMKLASGTAPVPEYLEGRRGSGSRHRRRGQQQRPRHVRGHAAGGISAQADVEGPAGGERADGARDGDDRRRARHWTRERLGSLEAGKLADLLVVRMDQPRQTPMYDPISHLVYTTRGDDVETTIVNGKVLMRAGKVLTLNQDASARAVALAAARCGGGQIRTGANAAVPALIRRRCRADCDIARQKSSP